MFLVPCCSLKMSQQKLLENVFTGSQSLSITSLLLHQCAPASRSSLSPTNLFMPSNLIFVVPIFGIEITLDEDDDVESLIFDMTVLLILTLITAPFLGTFLGSLHAEITHAYSEMVESRSYLILFEIVDWLEKFKYSLLYKIYNGRAPSHIHKEASKVNDHRCVLCWNSLSGPNIVVTGCGHKYHAHCLRRLEQEQYVQGESNGGYRCPYDKRIYSWTSKWKIR